MTSEAPKEVFISWPQPNSAGLAFVKDLGSRESYTLTTHALAMVAAALKPWNAVRGDSQGITGYHLNGDVAEWDELDLPETPADAQAALDAALKAERVKALREAATICNRSYGKPMHHIHRDICALIEKETGHE